MKKMFAPALLALALAACGDSVNPVAPARAGGTEPSLAVGYEPAASVMMVHGYSPGNGGFDCASLWANQKSALSSYGHTGRRITVGYYNLNTNCERNLSSTVYTRNYAGDWTLVRGTDNGRGGILDHNTPIEHVAYRLAWAIAKENTDNGAASVRVIGYSMGGLAIRYAIQQASAGNINFPTLTQMNVSRVITYGTPHSGTNYGWGGLSTQSNQMGTNSSFITSLNGDARVGSATWIGFTSLYTFTGDGVVENNSACWVKMTWCGRHYGSVAGNGYPSRSGYWHGDYMGDTNISYTLAEWDTKNPSTGSAWSARFRDVGAAGMAARNLAQY